LHLKLRPTAAPTLALEPALELGLALVPPALASSEQEIVFAAA
jgi:hypothetical protein